MIKNKYFLFIIILFATFLFYSCYTQSVKINEDGTSGTISYKLEINNSFYDFFSYLSNKQDIVRTFIDSLTDFKRFRKIIKKSQGITFLEQKTKRNKNSHNSNCKIAFSNSDYIPKEFNSIFNSSIVSDNLKNTCNILLSLSPISGKQSINQEYLDLEASQKELIDKYSKIVTFKFIIETSKPIITAKKGVISNTRKRVEYNYTLFDLLNSKNGINITVTYTK